MSNKNIALGGLALAGLWLLSAEEGEEQADEQADEGTFEQSVEQVEGDGGAVIIETTTEEGTIRTGVEDPDFQDDIEGSQVVGTIDEGAEPVGTVDEDGTVTDDVDLYEDNTTSTTDSTDDGTTSGGGSTDDALITVS